MCCSDDGKVYVTTNDSGVVVIDPNGDSIRAFVPTPYNPRTLCYDRTDNKVYAGLRNVNQVSVIDVDNDSVVANVPVVESCEKVCWNPNHDKVYVCGRNGDEVVVIDCTSDTVLKNLGVSDWLWTAYSDSVCDKVYFADVNQSRMWIADAARDRLYRGPRLGIVRGMLDNGRPYESNRFYCTANESVYVLSGATDGILRVIQVGVQPTALAWNPVHSWVYVSDSGSSSITVIRDTLTTGVEEGGPQAPSHKLQATVVRGVLVLGVVDSRQNTGCRAELLDIAGRTVLDLRPGANDVRALAPGVYFVREAPQATGLKPTAVRKIVVTR
jgi:YVTN family beta-propeller protein